MNIQQDEGQTLDVFLSYEHTSKPIADNIVSTLEAHKIRCWYAPRDVRGGYAASIMGAIAKCRVFVVVLNQSSSQSPQVLNEVEAAYARVMSGGLAIIPFRLDEQMLSDEMLYYVKRLHWIDASNSGVEAAIESLANQVFELLPDRKATYEASLKRGDGKAHRTQDASVRTANRYFEQYGEDATEEAQWLHLQNLILKDFDQPVYRDLLEDADNISVLDIGCSDGEVLNDRLGSRHEVASILGIDANEAMLAKAQARFGSDSRYTFLPCDVESAELEKVLRGYLDEHGLTGFDFVNMSMVLLHLRRPYLVFRTIRQFLNDGARVFIRDIDDGCNIAYPDPNGDFRRLNDLCAELPTTGCRTSGRQIFSMLKRAGYKHVELERSGLSTVGMDHDQRYALFMTCFDWLGGDLKVRSEAEPNNEAYRDDYLWFEEHVDDFEESFQDSSFFYQEGFMIFTARAPRRRL